MRRSFSIFFLLLTSLNGIGYYGLLWIAERAQVAEIASKIEENANEISGSLILKIPFGEAPTGAGYGCATGELEYGNDLYHVVKQRVHDGMLYVVLLRDHRGTEVRRMMAEYATNFSGENHERGSLIKVDVRSNDFVPGTFVGIAPPEVNSYMPSFGCPDIHYRRGTATGVFHPPQLHLEGSIG